MLAFLYEHGGEIFFGTFILLTLIIVLKPRSRRGLRNGELPPVRYPSQRVAREEDVIPPPNFRILEGAPLPLKPRPRGAPSMTTWARGLCPYEPERGDEPDKGIRPDTGE
jgi:hypothetical protein